MTYNVNKFFSLILYTGPGTIVMGDGSHHHISQCCERRAPQRVTHAPHTASLDATPEGLHRGTTGCEMYASRLER